MYSGTPYFINPAALTPPFQPTDDHVLIVAEKREEKTAGGLFLPDSVDIAQKQVAIGIVIATGPGMWNHTFGRRQPMDVRVGQRVIYGVYHATDVELGDDKFVLVKQDGVLGLLPAKVEATGVDVVDSHALSPMPMADAFGIVDELLPPPLAADDLLTDDEIDASFSVVEEPYVAPAAAAYEAAAVTEAIVDPVRELPPLAAEPRLRETIPAWSTPPAPASEVTAVGEVSPSVGGEAVQPPAGA